MLRYVTDYVTLRNYVTLRLGPAGVTPDYVTSGRFKARSEHFSPSNGPRNREIRTKFARAAENFFTPFTVGLGPARPRREASKIRAGRPTFVAAAAALLAIGGRSGRLGISGTAGGDSVKLEMSAWRRERRLMRRTLMRHSP